LARRSDLIPITPQTTQTLSGDELKRFCNLLYNHTGMLFGESKRYYIERRLFERMFKTNSPSFAAYFSMLRASPAELANVVNVFTVNETYFYREDQHLRCLSENILPEIIRRKGPGDKIRIWSQPCSTGEEAYSIALWLLENWPLVDAYNIEIVGSDIDTDALARASLGLYGSRSLARLPERLVREYFEPSIKQLHRIIGDLRESVQFTQANLMDAKSMHANGLFEMIFCRNVLIYFDEASRAKAMASLFGSLVPGGFICLGHTESMPRNEARFKPRRFSNALVYQRPE
jgi:chemotaxis protein methyltransferase CheR